MNKLINKKHIDHGKEFEDSQSRIYEAETIDSIKHDNCPVLNISFRNAGNDDVKVLAAMNRELIRDEGSENPMNLEQLEERMKDFLVKSRI